MLDKAAVTYQIILTKIDKISEKELEKRKQELDKEIRNHAAAYTSVIATSSAKNLGISKLRYEILSLI